MAVTSSADIQAAVSFANQYKVKMVIKNTGHEYQGRSSGPDTLQIWTHKLNSISISNNYTPDGGSASGPAAVIGSGVQAETREFSLRIFLAYGDLNTWSTSVSHRR